MEREKRLIHLDEALKATHKEIYWTESQQAAVRAFLVQQPKVDAVEVVRCKDCIHSRQGEWHTEKLICAHQSHMYSQVPFRMPPEHFCSYGERKENHVQSST